MDNEHEARTNVLQKIIDMMDEDIQEKMKKKGKGVMVMQMTIAHNPKKGKLDELREKLNGKR